MLDSNYSSELYKSHELLFCSTHFWLHDARTANNCFRGRRSIYVLGLQEIFAMSFTHSNTLNSTCKYYT